MTAVELLDTLTGWVLALIGLLIAVLSLIVAVVSARGAHRSARAAEASSEVAGKALRHAREAEDRRARAVVAELVQQVKLEHARGVELSQRLLREWQAAASLFNRGSYLARKKAELMTVPDELGRRVERAEQQDLGTGALHALSPDGLEDLTNDLRSDLAYLRSKADGFDEERRELTSRVEHERLLDAIRQLQPPGKPFPGSS